MALFNTRLAALLISLSVVLSAASASASDPAPAPASPSTLDELSSYFSEFKEHLRFLQDSTFDSPKERAAKDMTHYLKEHMEAAIKQVEEFSSTTLAKRLNDTWTDDYTKKSLLHCEEVYKGAVEALNNGMKSVSDGDFVQARAETHMFINNINACDDSSMEFQTFGEWAREVGGDCLAKIVEYMDPEDS
ncbi:hypothetical protein Salat_1025100 [Sesamum alatum]|uniref:Pectinesterase inhibitor domain-containing protein n=1 Tax=Sesamum alatum TaxID=300844 RepID=A0AAE1YM96_9LAMI|nr:hypothetical protein Salat_1024900 [Sesamum alatum]KAK4432629.1 hypothetical protein Salat_1025100 [Sesamum alatum]